MLIKQTRIITYVCPACGLTHFETISLFNFSGKSEVVVSCKCGKSQLKLVTKDYKAYNVSVPCMGCGNQHNYTLGFHEMWVKPINIMKCKQNKLEFCLVGNDNEVRKELDILEKEKDLVASNIGFEKSFSNSKVMLEAVNRVHDIAEQDNIICECGCKDISVYMLEDKIILHCTRCSGIEVIAAKDNFDLKNIMQKQQIVLCKQIQYI